MFRDEIAVFLQNEVGAHFSSGHSRPCSDTKRLAQEVTVHAWFETEHACERITSGDSMYYACANHGYFAFDVRFDAATSFGFVQLEDPNSGTLQIPAPGATEDFGFNWNRSSLRVLAKGKKDDCRISWLKAESPDGAGNVSTSVDVLT
jgi:hypothetical protein